MKYTKTSPRLKLQYINVDTEEVLLELNTKTWDSVGEMLSDYMVYKVLKDELGAENLPPNVMGLVIGEYDLV